MQTNVGERRVCRNDIIPFLWIFTQKRIGQMDERRPNMWSEKTKWHLQKDKPFWAAWAEDTSVSRRWCSAREKDNHKRVMGMWNVHLRSTSWTQSSFYLRSATDAMWMQCIHVLWLRAERSSNRRMWIVDAKSEKSHHRQRPNDRLNEHRQWQPLMNMWIENAFQSVIIAELLKHVHAAHLPLVFMHTHTHTPRRP